MTRKPTRLCPGPEPKSTSLNATIQISVSDHTPSTNVRPVFDRTVQQKTNPPLPPNVRPPLRPSQPPSESGAASISSADQVTDTGRQSSEAMNGLGNSLIVLKCLKFRDHAQKKTQKSPKLAFSNQKTGSNMAK